MVIALENIGDEYGEFVHSHGGFFQCRPYLDLLASALEISFSAIVARNGAAIVSVMPIAEACSDSLGVVVNSLPFYGTHGGVVGGEAGVQVRVLEWFQQYCERRQSSSWTVIEKLDDDHQCYAQHLSGAKLDSRIGQITAIGGEVKLMDSFHQKTRNMIRKAEKSGLEVFVDNTKLASLVDIHQRNMADIGGLAKPARFFESIPDFFSEKDYRIYCAFKDGSLVAGLLCFFWEQSVEYYTPVVEREYRSLQPLSLLIYRAMQDAQAEGFSWWNWGGTWDSQDGVYRFKSRWGAKDSRYYYHYKVSDNTLYNCKKDQLLSEFPHFYVLPFSELDP